MSEESPCKEHRTEQALAYAIDELEIHARPAFEAHLATCGDCQETVARARELLPAIERTIGELPPMARREDLVARITQERARIRAEQGPAWVPRFAWGAVLVGAAAAAFLVFARGRAPDFAAPRRPPPKQVVLEVPLAVDPSAPPAASAAVPHGATLVLRAQGKPGDREALVLAVDPRGRMIALWPWATGLTSAPCPQDCRHFVEPLDLAQLPANTLDLIIFMSPEPLSAPPGSGPATFPDAALRGRAIVHSL
jgi:hypothetical protein